MTAELPSAEPATSLATLCKRDAWRGVEAAAVAAAAMAIVEYAATAIAAPSGLGVVDPTWLLLLVLDVGLFAFGTLLLAPAMAAVAVAARLAIAAASRPAARQWRGLFHGADDRPAEPERRARRLWGCGVAAALFVAAAAVVNAWFSARFKAPQVAPIALALLQLATAIAAAGAGAAVAGALSPLARRLHGRLGRLNPFGSARMALAVLVVLALAAVRIAAAALPELAPLVPWRHMLSAAAMLAGVWAHGELRARWGSILPGAPAQRRRRGAIAAAAAAVVMAVALAFAGAHPATKTLAVSSSPPLASLVSIVRRANDFDRDGYGWLLGENDCAPFDAAIHPLARDIADNGIDENCNGRDFRLGDLPSYRSGERMPIPDAYRGDWNILLLTIDTLRYDHTGFGGYARDTTPNLDALMKRSVSFSFCQAPSAGTMASVPAILTSRFFHSGIALDENVKPRRAPRLLPENVLIGEVMKRGGYRTGAILSHYYFNDWGMEQGFDTYDNSIGAKEDARIVAADRLTDRALAWVGERGAERWFLWVHYIDPHGRYVPHPGEKSYGTTEMDLYDGEVRWTDKQVGRLLKELARLPGGDRTVVIVTSDHGDAFNEHGFINHGQALYREILHVPLIIYVPNIEPRVADGAVSPIDVFPTMADLGGIDISDVAIEGESLVPQLFYRRDRMDRVVFAETNYRHTLRAAVNRTYKLVYNISANVHELYDLRVDPWEKRNVRSVDRAGFDSMKAHMDDWLERVYYARDRKFNQVMHKLDDVILSEPPTPQHPVSGLTFDGGRIEVLGFDTDKPEYRPGDKAEITVYLRAAKPPSADFRMGAEARWAGAPERSGTARSVLRHGGDGQFPTSRWRAGEMLAERFKISLPAWSVSEPAELALGFKLVGDASGAPVVPSRSALPDDPAVARLGTLPLTAAPPPPPTPPPGALPSPAPGSPTAPAPRGSRGSAPP